MSTLSIIQKLDAAKSRAKAELDLAGSGKELREAAEKIENAELLGDRYAMLHKALREVEDEVNAFYEAVCSSFAAKPSKPKPTPTPAVPVKHLPKAKSRKEAITAAKSDILGFIRDMNSQEPVPGTMIREYLREQGYSQTHINYAFHALRQGKHIIKHGATKGASYTIKKSP